MVQLYPILEAFIQYFLFYIPFIILAFIVVVGLAKYHELIFGSEDEKTRRRKAQLRKYPDFRLDLNRDHNLENEHES